MLSILRLLSAALAATTQVLASAPLSPSLQDILSKAGIGPYTYPTSLTQDIIPKGIHSHNDYWRPVPFYSALAAGAISVEADVYLINDTLYVGHELSALTAERTFDSLYVQPILETLLAQNPETAFSTARTFNGVYDTEPRQTLYLFVDVKTDGPSTWRAVIDALQPLREKAFLTTFDGFVVPGAVTVIGTGGTPLDLVQGVSPRDYFYDCPLTSLAASNLTADVSPFASGSFAATIGEVRNLIIGESELSLLRDQISAAHEKDIKVRYWDLPAWPVGTRNAVWRALWDSGVDLLNVDDLDAVTGFWDSLG